MRERIRLQLLMVSIQPPRLSGKSDLYAVFSELLPDATHGGQVWLLLVRGLPKSSA
jgi:hypothetical protein